MRGDSRVSGRPRLAPADLEPADHTGDPLREREALLAISTTVSSTLDVREALRRICRELTRLLGADTGAAYLHDAATDQLSPVAGYRVPKELLPTLLTAPMELREQGFYVPLWTERQPIFSDDVAADARFSHELFRRLRHQSGLLVPLMLDDAVVGAFYLVWWTARRRLREAELGLVERVVEHVATLLRNAGLFEKAERERRHLETMYEIARRLAAVHDTSELLRLLVDEASDLLGVEAAGIRLIEGDDLVVGARTELAAPLMTRARIKIGESLSGQVVATGAPVAVEDLLDDIRYDTAHKQGALARGFHGFLGVPLRLHGRVIGTLNVYTTARRRFSRDEVSLLSALADQASLAIHKARLLREAEDARRVVEGLHRVAVSMQASRERDDRLEVFTRGAQEVVGFERVAVLLATTDGTRLEMVSSGGDEGSLASGSLPLSSAAGPLFEVIQTGRPIAVLEDGDLHGMLPLDATYAGDPRFRTRRFVAAPLAVGERVLGVAVADNKRSQRPIPRASIEPFSLLCQQLALALEEARLYAESRDREREATKLYAVTSQLGSSLDLDQILDHITTSTVNLLDSDAAGIYTYDEMRGGLTCRRAVNLDSRLVHDLVLKPGEGVAGRAYQEQRPVWTCDRLADPALAHTLATDEPITAAAAPACLAAPIVIREDVQGVLVASFFEPHEFRAKEVQLLSTLAGHAAIAIDNARHYEAMRTQQARLAQIFDSTSDGIMLVNGAGRIEAANRRAGDLFEVDPNELAGLELSELMARYRADIPDLRSLTGEPDRAAQGDLEIRPKQRVLHWVAQPTRNASGAAGGVTLTFRDVTQEREVSQMKSDFVSFVTHQLRTPLAGIKWMLELAGQEAGVPADAGSYVEDARQAAHRLIGLVNDLLDISRLERGKLAIAMQEVELGELTRGVLSETALLLEERGHRLSVSGTAEAPWVLADPQLLRQVILNLVSNAIKYTPPGGAITIRMGREGEDVRWSISDTGIGIPQSAQARLFEKFYRADNVVTIETEGTGLGLYLVRLIMEQLGGGVRCESLEGRGSTFTFTLPSVR